MPTNCIMSAISGSLPSTGHLSGLATSSLINLDSAPTIVSSSYIDFGNHIMCNVLFATNATTAADTPTSFSFTCSQFTGITFNGGTINALGIGSATAANTPITVAGVDSSNNVSVYWIVPTGTSTGSAGITVSFTVFRA